MATVYLNTRTSQGVETVDEFTREAGQDPKEFRKYVNEMVSNYHLAGMNVYKSTRPTKEWKETV
ncbi:MAG TPA: hypothetical protein VK625_00160 [Flavitalea sp.]|nr:hypothetical protein [Flavitalea sp.]